MASLRAVNEKNYFDYLFANTNYDQYSYMGDYMQSKHYIITVARGSPPEVGVAEMELEHLHVREVLVEVVLGLQAAGNTAGA
jgi:hypothetical protein